MVRAILAGWLMALAGCTPLLPHPLPDVLVLGEQHDAASHQRLHREVIEALAARGELAGVALEMAEHGHTTAGLPRDASETQVRAALAWGDGTGWPWASYAPAVMAAVRAGVPVAGANLAAGELKRAGADASLDASVSAAALRTQIEDVKDGHCGLLPDAQLLPLARMQIARDGALATSVRRVVVPGKTAVLITGAHHADPTVGVPLHLPPSLRSVSRLWPPEPAKHDYCAQLREHLRR
jgi:uncharacterized iron-regulated protein